MADDAPRPDEVDSDLVEGGLAAAFGRSLRPGESVLDAFERQGAPRPAIRLDESMPLGSSDGSTRSHTHYTFSDEIGRGGVGVVIRGTDVDLGRDVALKVLREEYVEHPQALARFVEEAQIEGQLQHPGIVPVYELGMAKDGRPFFAMKLVAGQTLAKVFEEREDVTTGRRRLVGIFEQICQAMAYAHARGVVHRDLKPGNVMVGSFGEVQIVDWGLAKVLGRDVEDGGLEPVVRTVRTESTDAETRMGTAMGTPSYMPREQALGRVEEIDERCDVFALGAILLEILTGAPPYPAEAPDVLAQAALARLDDAWTRLDACAADAELKALCRACLDPERERRPRDAKAVAESVGAYLAGVEDRARQAELEAAEARVRAQSERKARRLTTALAGAVLFAGVVLGGGYLWRASDLREREEQAGRAVAAALGEVQESLGAARRASVGDLESWRAARDAARRAEEVARTGGASAAVVASTVQTLEGIEAEYDVAEVAAQTKRLDDETAARLDDVRSRRGQFLAFLEVEEDYAEAFRAYGLDLAEMSTPDAAVRIRESAIAGALCTALDDWAFVRTRYDGTQAERAAVLREIADRSDPDAVRIRVRAAAAGLDLDAFRTLQAELEGGRLDPDTALLLAQTHAILEGPHAACEPLELAAVAHPDDFWTHFQLGVWYLAEQPPRAEEALDHLHAAVALRPDNADARLHLGHALRTLERWDEAIAVYEEALRVRPDKLRPHVFIIDALKGKGRLEVHLEGLFLEEQQRPGDGLLKWQIALSLGQLERYAEAIEYHEHTVALLPDLAMSHAGIGICRHMLMQFAEAERPLRKATELEPWHALWWVNLAYVLQSQEKAEPAAAAYREALRCAPDNPQNHIHYVGALADLDDVPGAVEAYRELERRFADHPYLANAGFALARTSQWGLGQSFARRLARETIERLEVLQVTDPARRLNYRGMVGILNCEVLDDFEKAVSIFSTQHFGPQMDQLPWLNLGIASMRLGLLDEAIEAFHRFPEQQPGVGRGWWLRGLCLMLRGRAEEAEASYREALKTIPEWSVVHANLGLSLLAQGKVEEAREVLLRFHGVEPWPEDRPTSAEAWATTCAELFAAYERLQTVQESDLDSMDPRALRMVALVGGETLRTREAARLIERAFEAEPALADEFSIWRAPLLYSQIAAYMAGSAASGFGRYDAPPSEAEAAHYRTLARRWLSQAIASWRSRLPTLSDERVAGLFPQFLHWQEAPNLAVLREGRFLEKLSPEEQEACRALWDEVQSLIHEAERRLPDYPGS